MDSHDGKRFIEPKRPRPVRRRKKRLVTDRMRAANQRNARLSTGPKTPRGRERASLNATTLGLTCTKLVFLPGESPDEFESEVADWARRLRATTAPEIAQVQTAVYNLWKARRADNADAWAVTKEIDRINDQFENEKAREVWDLIPKLTAEPKKTVQKLMDSTYGCGWLIDQFTLIGEWLKSYSSLEVSQRRFALNIGGYDPKDLFTDPFVMEFNRNYLSGISGKDGFTAAEGANAFMDDRTNGMSYSELERQMVRHVIDLPTLEQGHAFLLKYVTDSIERLRQWSALIALREERDKASAIGAAQSDVTPAGSKRQGYSARSLRIQFAAIRTLFAIQHERRKSGEGDQAATAAAESAPEVGPDESRGEPSTGGSEASEVLGTMEDREVFNKSKNEPVATPVAGVGNDSPVPDAGGGSTHSVEPALEPVVEQASKGVNHGDFDDQAHSREEGGDRSTSFLAAESP